MKTEETKATQKYQTNIPKKVRKYLKVKPRQTVSWHVIRSLVVVDSHKRLDNPVEFLTSQIRSNIDAVKLVKETREKFE